MLRRSPRLLFVLVLLAVSAIATIPFVPLAHADIYSGFTSANAGVVSCQSGASHCDGQDPPTVGMGTFVPSPFTGTSILSGVGFYTGTNLPLKLVIVQFAAGQAPAIRHVTTNCNALFAGECPLWIMVSSPPQSFTVIDVETLSGLSNLSFFSIALQNTVSVPGNTWVGILLLYNEPVPGAQTNALLCESGCDTNVVVAGGGIDFGTTSPIAGQSYSNAGGFPSVAVPIQGATFRSSSAPTGQILSQCYGNCGTPAVTLVNTNSTHTVPFNNSITLLYEAQSSLTGFVNNITTSVARSYLPPYVIDMALYTVDRTCTNNGGAAFTRQCPGFQVATFHFQSSGKGRISFSTNAQILSGQWFGVAFSAQLTGMDLNDTNANSFLPLSQVSGDVPTTITTGQSLGVSKMGLWAWVTGPQVIPSTGGGGSSNGPCQQVSCGLTQFTGSLGGDTGAAVIAWIVLSFLMLLLAMILTRGNPLAMQIGAAMVFMGSMALLVVFSLYGLLPGWIPLMLLTMVALGVAFGIWRGRFSSNNNSGVM